MFFEKELQNANLEAAKAKEENQEVSDVICEKCGAHMIVKMSRYGKYLASARISLSCKNIKPYHTGEEKEEVSEIDCDKWQGRWCTSGAVRQISEVPGMRFLL